jgi:single-strand DNA-binding protein
MAAINNFTIIGNVTKDLELKYTAGGTATVTYTVAVDDVRYDNTGTKQENCDFIPVTTYGKQAENDAKYLKKGTCVAVHGRIRSWYNPEQRKGGFNFEAIHVQYLGRPNGGNRQASAGAGAGNPDDDSWVSDYERAEKESAQQPPQAPRGR